ncbi:Uncharacterised protein [Klebsiella pneumoniae subsp. ozaenae]|uniref:ParE-like toxin domain-containing protein n=1 Tax=Klebsiella pneumoniae subsp. ozaenae TaxID=574 RepID=A0A378AQ92_KLEPO|nr:Uncharacterised protein [Klebsiella pneumoniae subsp. ozaenae]
MVRRRNAVRRRYVRFAVSGRGRVINTRLDEKGCGYYKIDLGPFWRLLSRNEGRTWLLLSHERYNSAIRK